MKRIIILTLAFIFAASFSFAATTKSKTKEMSGKNKTESVLAAGKTTKAEMKETSGMVKTVTVANPSKGTKSEVMVMDDKSVEKSFLVNSTTTIYDTNFKAIGLDKLKANEKIKVKYITTKEGVNEATSINVLS